MSSYIKFYVKRARRAQRNLRERIIMEDVLPSPLRLICGLDASYKCGQIIATAVLLSVDSLEVVEWTSHISKPPIPYIPTLLAFREAPALMAAIRQLSKEPDLLVVDGHGYAHPFRCGIASHLGVVLNKPSIGVAKKILCGTPQGSAVRKWRPVVDKGEIIGAEVYTVEGEKPIYVSIGHRVSLPTAVKLVLEWVRGHRLPEPTRLAHHYSRVAVKEVKCRES